MNQCEKHQRDLEILCIDCNELICIECSVTSVKHKIHNLVMVTTMISNERKKIRSIIAENERECDQQEILLSKLFNDKITNTDAINECDNTTLVDSLLMTKYIKCGTTKCLLHEINADIVCSDCKECICFKCLIDHKNVHREHNLTSKDEIIVSIKQDIVDIVNETNQKIQECQSVIVKTNSVILKQKELLALDDKDILSEYMMCKKTSLPTYSDNKIAIREILRKKQFEKLLDYSEYDLKCMVNRSIDNTNFITYIFKHCSVYKIICHFVDNVIDLDFNVYERSNMCCRISTYSNILQYAFNYSTMEIIMYIAEKIKIPDNIWNSLRPEDDTFVSFFEYMPTDWLISFINKHYNPDNRNFITAAFCNLDYKKDILDKVYYIIDNVIDFNNYVRFYHTVTPNNLIGYVIRYSKPAILQYIINKGVDLEEDIGNYDDTRQSIDYSTGTPIMIAIYYKNIEAIKMLICAKVNLEHENANGNRPIHFAIYGKVPEIILLLIDAQVDLTCKNTKGETPLDIAQKYNVDQSIIDLIATKTKSIV